MSSRLPTWHKDPAIANFFREADRFFGNLTDMYGQLVAHKTRHENAGDDEISIADLSGEAADDQKPKDHSHDGTAHQGGKLAQANTHESPDTDDATTSIHHTIDATGASATKAAAANHGHTNLPTTDEKTALNGGHLKPKAEALPVAAEAYRGQFWAVEGAALVTDELWYCYKDNLDAYQWKQLAP